MASVVLTAKQHASDGRRSCTKPDKGTRLGVFNGIQSFHFSSVLDHFDATLFHLHVFAVVALDGSHVDAEMLWHFSRMANGV
jgi:hypothetical protein